jgi:hypothetical protein
MNTAQLVVLWYAGLAVVGLLLNQAAADSSPGYLICAITLTAGLLVYTLKPHPSARKRRVLLALAGPPLLILLAAISFWGYSTYRESRSTRDISPSQIQIDNPVLREQFGTTRLLGRVRNNSPHRLVMMTLEIIITEGSDTVERLRQDCWVDIPPGEVRELDEGLYGLKTKMFTSDAPVPRFAWRFTIATTKGKAYQGLNPAAGLSAAVIDPAGGGDPRTQLSLGQFREAGRRFAEDLKATKGYSIEIIVACSEETLKKMIENVGASELYILPISLKGNDCYRVCWGHYDSEAGALRAVSSLPSYLRIGTKPRVFSIADIRP